MEHEKKVILLAGPTASGKSKLAIKLAQYFNGEIINADSMQIYKEFSILTSKPDSQDTKIVKHHLYGFNSVKKKFSTGHWLKMVTKKIEKQWENGKTPIVVGGTGLYFKTLTDGLVRIPDIPNNIRTRVRTLHKKIGSRKFFAKLIKLDPLAKRFILSSDSQRVMRAYEVKKFTKKSLHDWFKDTKPFFLEDDFFKIYIDFPREELIERISKRTKLMMKLGAINEVKRFIKLKVKKDKSANKAIGVSEIKEYLNNKKDIQEIVEKISIKTRQYAKRQNTWARGNMTNWFKLQPREISKFLKKI